MFSSNNFSSFQLLHLKFSMMTCGGISVDLCILGFFRSFIDCQVQISIYGTQQHQCLVA